MHCTVPLTCRTALHEDFEALVALRMRAMRESLERIGRFDPERARSRLRDSFEPAHMRVFLHEGAIIGCVTVRTESTWSAWVEHFYLEPSFQGQGIGAAILAVLHQRADQNGVTLRLSVLRESDANRFYRRHGYQQTHADAFDIYYERQPVRSPAGPIQTP